VEHTAIRCGEHEGPLVSQNADGESLVSGQ
jgi:hypothetical protein